MSDNYHIIISTEDSMTFEWDENKNEINTKKHGVDFKEASTVFYDECAILFDDPDHSIEEERFLLIGTSRTLKVLTVCHCIRDKEAIRIISARKATKTETKFYDQYGGKL